MLAEDINICYFANFVTLRAKLEQGNRFMFSIYYFICSFQRFIHSCSETSKIFFIYAIHVSFYLFIISTILLYISMSIFKQIKNLDQYHHSLFHYFYNSQIKSFITLLSLDYKDRFIEQ